MPSIPDYGRTLYFSAVVVLVTASPVPAYSDESGSRVLIVAAAQPEPVGTINGDASGAGSPRERAQLLRMVAGAMEAESMARYAAGPHWKEMSEPEQVRYTTLFARHLMAMIADLLPEQAGGLATQPWTTEPREGGMVMSTSISVNNTPVSIAVLLHGTPPRILDVIVDSVSLAKVEREGITSVAGRYGIKVMLAELEERSRNGEMNQWRVLAQHRP